MKLWVHFVKRYDIMVGVWEWDTNNLQKEEMVDYVKEEKSNCDFGPYCCTVFCLFM